VFKAADVAWISSRDFTFKFDKTKFLSRVTPIWADFSRETRPGWTSIHLKLSKAYEEDTLIRELLIFNANLLLFLRHVREIHIHIASENETAREQRI
jgi:hypothetical protein